MYKPNNTLSRVTDKWSPLFVVIYIYWSLNQVHVVLLFLAPSLSLSFSVSTSQQALYLKGKELGPTCGHEPRSHSKCQLSSSFSRLPGAYMFRQSPNWYPNIMILVKPSILIGSTWQPKLFKGSALAGIDKTIGRGIKPYTCTRVPCLVTVVTQRFKCMHSNITCFRFVMGLITWLSFPLP